MNLDIRLKRMEDAQAGSRLHGERRVIRIIAGENDTRAAYALAKERGFDAEDETSNDLIILRVV